MPDPNAIPATEAFMLAGYVFTVLLIISLVAYLVARARQLRAEQQELDSLLTEDQRKALDS